MIVEFLDEARQELIEAALWYEGKEPGLGKRFRDEIAFVGMLKKAASGVLAILPCSRTPCTLRASKWLRPCWTDFFEHSLQLMLPVYFWA